MKVTVPGIISVASSTANSTSRPGKTMRAKAYPASVQVTSIPTMVVAVMITLLRK